MCSPLKLLAETCWRHNERRRGRLKHTRAAELIGPAGESDSSALWSCDVVMEKVRFCILRICLGTWPQRGRNDALRYGQVMSHDFEARAVAKEMEEVRSRC